MKTNKPVKGLQNENCKKNPNNQVHNLKAIIYCRIVIYFFFKILEI